MNQLAHKVVQRLLGEYFEYDRKQLKVGLFAGDVVLKGIQLKADALDMPDAFCLLHGTTRRRVSARLTSVGAIRRFCACCRLDRRAETQAAVEKGRLWFFFPSYFRNVVRLTPARRARWTRSRR